MNTFLRSESGATAIEYSLFLALISMAIIATATALGTQLSTSFSEVATALAAQ